MVRLLSGKQMELGSLMQALVLSLLAAASATAAPAPAAVTEYDYVVIGSGPGGGPLAANLAKAGYSVFLLEAGDASPPQGAQYPPSVTWDFFVKHYPDGDQRNTQYSHLTWMTPQGRYWVGQSGAPEGSKPLGVYYPRGATLGGSSMINAMATWLPSDSDWDAHYNVTGDESWKAENMRKLFMRIERNNYLPKETAGHGFNGWFHTNMASRAGNGMTGGPFGGGGGAEANAVMRTMASDLNLTAAMSDLLIQDPNALIENRDQIQGIYGLVQHQYANGQRYSSRDYVQETVSNGSYAFTVSMNSLATRVLFDTASKCGGALPRATAVEYLEGRSLYAADPRRNPSSRGTKKVATAKREVIVSGGTFNTPQILMLSGVGPKAELQKFEIPIIKDAPGVGRNLMDNQEMPIVGQTPPGSDSGIGAGNGATGVAMIKTNHPAHGERDMFVMQGPYVFRGFWPSNQTAQLPAEVPGVYGVSMVKNHPVNTKGWVKLRSADPLDTPDINFNLYAEGADTDLGAMKDTIAWIRTIYRRLGMTPREPPCSGELDTKGFCSNEKDDDDWIHKQTFGHHPTSTCRIGADNDPMAVLDSKFKVRGVDGLRVVDASVFTRIPGVFPSVSTFMISQKASDDMISELEAGKAIKVCSVS